jgi:hypothetical protein
MFMGSVNAFASGAEKPNPELTERQKVRLQEISQRVEEIKSLDRSKLSREERKEIKNELLEMKKESKALSGGVYLSATAIIIILLVLILIF